MNAAHATSSRLAACGLASLLLLAPLGCGGSNTPIGRVISSTKAMVDLIRTIKDPASATAATPKLKPAFDELGQASAALAAIITDPSKALTLISEAQRSMAEMGRLQEELQAEEDRLDKLKGLPAEFWNVYRVEEYRFAQTAVSSVPGGEDLMGPVQQVCALYDQYGPQRVVEVELRNSTMGDSDAAVRSLTKLAGKGAQVVSVEDPSEDDVLLVSVAPVEDFDKLAKAIDFGDVTDQEQAKGEIVVELPDAEEQPSEEAYADESASADGSEYAAERPAFDEYGNPIPSDPYAEVAAEAGDQPKTLGSRLEDAAKSRVNNMVGMVTTIIAAERAAAEARATNGPQRGDRDYHVAMAEILYDAQSPHHERAVTELLEVKPTEVADKKVRARIANGYRQLAFAENSAHGPKAIDGLVHWGGKFSAPLLIQLLEKQTSGNDEAIYNALGKAATPEAADAVVKRLQSGSGAGGDGAFACLRTMGPVAEPALIKALPFESPESNRAAIEVLGDIGTRKSLSLLRRATKSENPEVKEAALASLRSIQERIRKEKPTTPTSAPKKPAAAASST